MKVRDLIKLLEAKGWKYLRTKGSHRQYKHSKHEEVITVAGKPGTDVPIGTLKSIVKKAGIDE
jgi:predicted RNA binding protein YcfA (HicA-like mRNA interferase family)